MAENEKVVKEEKSPIKTEQRFSKQQILTSAQYTDRRDLLEALLESDKQYTKKEVNGLINKFMKGKVQ